MSAYVLVHGAFHGGWCWRDVATRLRAAGHTVFAPTLTGLGERSHLAAPAVDLSTHIRDVINLLLWEDLHEVVLVGHSYGGMVVTGVADQAADRLKTLVYLDAVVPADGQSVLDVQTPDRRAEMLEAIAAAGGWRWPPRTAAFYGVRDPVAQAWVDGNCTPQPFLTLAEAIRLSAPAGTRVGRKLYILCTDPPLPYMRQFYDQAARAEDWNAIELETGHDAMVTEPDRLTQILMAWGEAGAQTTGT